MGAKVLVWATSIFLAGHGIAAAQSPAMHEGNFEMGAPSHCGGHNWCGRVVGPDALRREGLQVTQSGDSLAWGQGPEVSVMVLCKPDGNNSFAIVVAASMNSSIAERVRNSVRSHMVGARCL